MSIQIVISYPEIKPPSQRPAIWLVKHWIQQPDNDRPYNRPEVEPLFPAHFSPFGRPWQMRVMGMNPKISPKKLTNSYDWETMVTNENGFGKPGDPRRNYFTGENMDSNKDIKVENLKTGGSLVTGFVKGSNLVVKALDWRMTPPSVQFFDDNPWYVTWFTTVDINGIPRRFAQGLQPDGTVEPIRHPFVCDTEKFSEITIPMKKLIKWELEDLPDPWTVY